MALLEVLLELAVVVTAMLAVATLVIVGPRSLVAALREFRWRLEACLVPVAALAIVLLVRWLTQDVVQRLERDVVRNNISPYLFELDRALFDPVLVLQSFQTDVLTSYFVFVYIYGYAFLLLFPFVAYFALEDVEEFRTLVLAFTANYGIGLVCYTLFLAFGPRNVDPAVFDGLLYDAYPQAGWLTFEVNQATNVFPSLHTSLSMTVFGIAWLTRDRYPVWCGLAGVLAVSVALSTMYLGIHWFTDVVAGTILAAVSVYVGVNYTVEGIVDSVRRFVASDATASRADGE